MSGWSLPTFKKILKKYGVTIIRSRSNFRRKRRPSFVNRHDAEKAVEKHMEALSRTENIRQAAIARGICRQALRRMVIAAGAIPADHRPWKSIRLPSKMFDDIIEMIMAKRKERKNVR